MLIRIYLGLAALAFAPFGLWSLLQPLGMTSSLGVEVSGPNGAYEMSGIYGGVSLAAALLSAAGALTVRFQRPALWFLATYMGGYVFARAAASLMHGPPTSQFFTFIAFEVVMLVGAAGGLHAKRGS